jgi:hypothetical protein
MTDRRRPSGEGKASQTPKNTPTHPPAPQNLVPMRPAPSKPAPPKSKPAS